MNKLNKKAGLTLAELVVVVTILSILSTIGFVSFNGYAKEARETARITDVNNIQRVLQLSRQERGKYPIPTNPLEVTYSGAVVWTQGEFGTGTLAQTGKLFGELNDPKYGNKYSYSVTRNQAEYQLGVVYETNREFGEVDEGPIVFSFPSFTDDTYAAAYPFRPDTLGPKVWLDGQDPNGNNSVSDNPAHNTDLTSWVNKGSGGNAGINHGALKYTHNAINGHPAPFVASDKGLLVTDSDITDGDIFYVVQNKDPYGATDAYGRGLQSVDKNMIIGYINDRKDALFIQYPTVNNQGAPRHIDWNDSVSSPSGRLNPFIYGFHKTGNQFGFYRIGNLRSQGATNPIAGNTWAVNQAGRVTSQPADMLIGEVLVYDTPLTIEERQKVEGYLAWKWSLQTQLPGSHPYRWEEPTSDTPPEPEKPEFSNVYVYGDYNKMITHTRDGDTNYILATPSIMSYDSQDTDFLNIMQEGKLVYHEHYNYPSSYDIESDGFDFQIIDPVLFEGNKQDLASYQGLKEIDSGIQSTYSQSIIYPDIAGYVDSESLGYLENILGNIIGINPIKPYYCSDIASSKGVGNVAPEAHISISGSYSAQHKKENLVNGIKRTDGYYDYEFHSNNTNAWVEFEWDDPQAVGYVRIFNRTRAASHRLTGAKIQLFDDNNTKVYEYTLWDTTNDRVIDLDLNGIGEQHIVKKVRLQTNNQYLNVREIEIYTGGDLEDGYYLVDDDGAGGKRPYEVYCDMTTDGGGWTLLGDNIIDRGDFTGGHSTLYPGGTEYYNRENNILIKENPLASPFVIRQTGIISGSPGSNTVVDYELQFDSLLGEDTLLKKGNEIRISAWVANAWDQGDSFNGGRGYIFQNTLTYTDGTKSYNGDKETLEEKTIDGVLWKHQRVRIPITKDVSSFIWEVGKGAETTTNREILFTGLEAKIYYK